MFYDSKYNNIFFRANFMKNKLLLACMRNMDILSNGQPLINKPPLARSTL